MIREGDLVFIDIGAMWNGYFADIGRTVICGTSEPAPAGGLHGRARGARAGTDAMQPGQHERRRRRAVARQGAAAASESTSSSLFIGHGIGVGANEPPYVGEACPAPRRSSCEAGMTIAIEPLIWVPESAAAAACGSRTRSWSAEGGGRPLTRTAFDERLLIA